jgi:hypothetical protein
LICYLKFGREPGRILLHHVGWGGDACRQAEALEARSNLFPSPFDDCYRKGGNRCGRFLWRCSSFVDSLAGSKEFAQRIARN